MCLHNFCAKEYNETGTSRWVVADDSVIIYAETSIEMRRRCRPQYAQVPGIIGGTFVPRRSCRAHDYRSCRVKIVN